MAKLIFTLIETILSLKSYFLDGGVASPKKRNDDVEITKPASAMKKTPSVL